MENRTGLHRGRERKSEAGLERELLMGAGAQPDRRNELWLLLHRRVIILTKIKMARRQDFCMFSLHNAYDIILNKYLQW